MIINFASENTGNHSSKIVENVPFPAKWPPLKQEEDIKENEYMALDDYHPSHLDIGPEFQINEKELSTSFGMVRPHFHLDGSTFSVNSMDELQLHSLMKDLIQ